MNVLIVDDEILALKKIERLLHDSNGQPLHFNNIIATQDPNEALKVARSQPIHLAFLDISMPTIEGFELAEQLLHIHPSLQIVFVTAYQGYAVKAFEMNALDYLVKPVHARRLALTIERVVKQQQLLAQLDNTKSKNEITIGCFQNLHYLQANNHVQLFPWKTLKAAELFAYLIHRRNKTVAKEVLIDLLWPDFDFDKANAQLHTSIYQVRQVIRTVGLDLELNFMDRGYRLVWGKLKLDVELWEEAVRTIPPITPKTVPQYVALATEYKGDYLEEHHYVWAQHEQDRLRLLWLNVMKQLAEYYNSFDNSLEAITLYKKMIDRLPLIEDGYFGLMRAYASLNYVTNVRNEYEKLTKVLQEELEVSPSPELNQWYQQWESKL